MKINDKVKVIVPAIHEHQDEAVGVIEGMFDMRGIKQYKVRANGMGWYYNEHQIEKVIKEQYAIPSGDIYVNV